MTAHAHARSFARTLAIALLVAAAAVPASAVPLEGGSLLSLLGSAQALSYGPSATALDAPWADRLNPAASAAQQRTVFDAGYTALTDFGKGQGMGSAGFLGLSLPKPYGVWNIGLTGLTTPDDMTDLPLGSVFQASGGIAKDLSSDFYVGSSVDLQLGKEGWGAGLNLGVIKKAGDRGFLKDLRWGITLTDIGKSYSGDLTAPFTLSAGIRGLIVRTDTLKWSVGADLGFPTFQDVDFGLSTGITFRDVITFRTAWNQSFREIGKEDGRSLLPAFGLSAVIPLSRKSSEPDEAKREAAQAELRPAVAAAPLYGDVWALGGSVTVPLGTIDRKPPRIDAEFPASKWGPAYVSPNNDGVQDALEIPVKITDQRYVVGWTLTIADEKGEAVRKIFNKESRPETEGFKGFWDRLTYVKKGVDVPDELVWNGVADSGQVAPDGKYSATIEAVDDNGNRGSVGPFPIVVDDTPPAVEVSVPENPPIFSPDGDGHKETLLVKLSGSPEDLWKAQVADGSGKAARSLQFADAAPSDWTWDGKSDEGKIVPDGVYAFSIAATDRAGNSASKKFDNILVNTQQPPIALVIDLAAFSPNGDGVKDAVTLLPSVPVKAGVTSWTLSVLDKGGTEVWARKGADASALQDRSLFDGRDAASLKTLPEGQYKARLAVTYLNGHSPKADSPAFILDVTPPSGTVKADRPAFNPAGSQGQNAVRFIQKGDKDARWTGEVTGPDGAAVRRYAFAPEPDPEVEWDGSDDAGKPAPDGVYSYRLKGTDVAGNAFASAPVSVSVDTAKKAVRIVADLKAFSPLPGSAKDRLTLTAQVQGNEKVRSYELSIYPAPVATTGASSAAAPAVAAAPEPVRSWKDSRGVPATFVWDGATDAKAKAPDGRYSAKLSVSYLNGDAADSTTSGFTIDTQAPSIKVSAAPLLFSPNEGSKNRLVRITQKSVPGDDWTGVISDAAGNPVRTWTWKGLAADFSWDGKDEAGNTVADGKYRYDVASTDAAGNKGSGSVPAIAVDQRQVQVFVTSSESGISPNGDGYKDTVSFNLIVKLREGIDGWRFALVDRNGAEKSVFAGKGNDVPNKIVWDGRDSAGAVVQGDYVGVFTVDYQKGDRAEARTAKILVSNDAPKAEVSLTPDIFSPDNDGVADDVTIGLDVQSPAEIAAWKFEVRELAVVEGAKSDSRPAERVFKSWSGQGAPAKSFVWDGRSDRGELVESATDYPFVFTVSDVLGNSARVEGAISVDVLVIREGNRLKIKVPSIVFRPNGADFKGLDEATIANNARVIKRIAQILNKFRDYGILIEGHANSEGKIGGYSATSISSEETKELIPLSTGRAELVKSLLGENGVDTKRLSTKGMGSSEPVVDFKDSQNRWKNRRVEFILIKSQAGGSPQ
jgi:outer membrane protein OmpA-like peptidoglycan-associated protein/flagellar hook assembly protein FlgD